MTHTLDTLLQASTRRQAELYFSIVRRRLAWASRLSLSTSLRMRILKLRWPFRSIGLLLAMSCKQCSWSGLSCCARLLGCKGWPVQLVHLVQVEDFEAALPLEVNRSSPEVATGQLKSLLQLKSGNQQSLHWLSCFSLIKVTV